MTVHGAPHKTTSLPWRFVAVAAVWVGCSGKSQDEAKPAPAEAPSTAALKVRGLSLQPAAAPRPGGPLIAGEKLRVGLTIAHGTGPYRLELRSLRSQRERGSASEVRAIQADTRISGSGETELALALIAKKQALSGKHRLNALVTDTRGATASANLDFQLIGDDAPQLARKTEPPLIEILDSGGRRRKELVRGEPVVLHALIPGAAALGVTIADARGAPLTPMTRLPTSKGELRMPFSVPGLARPGDYEVSVSAGAGKTLKTTLRVGGAPFPPLSKLTVDDLALYGGKDGRAPRTGMLRLGEHLVVHARVGGGQREVAASLMIISRGGKKLLDVEFARARVADPSSRARMLLTGSVLLPREKPFGPGRYRIQVEVNEGDQVSMRTREVLLR